MKNSASRKELDGSETHYTEFPLEEDRLVEFFREIFTGHWNEVVFGPCLEGAVFEIQLSDPSKSVDYRDGYLTVDTGKWHFHLCLGRPKTASEELSTRRRAARAAFFESRNKSCVPMSFGFRMWNGAGEQMISIFFPNPYLSGESKLKKPDWSRLHLWRNMKSKYTGDDSLCLVPEEALS